VNEFYNEEGQLILWQLPERVSGLNRARRLDTQRWLDTAALRLQRDG